MSTNFPVTLDTYAALVDNTDDVLAAHPNDRGDAIEALEAKVGVDSSVVATSHDYKINALETATRTVPLGGTGAATLTDHGILLGSGTGAVTPSTAMTNGQLLVGQTGADPLPKTITGNVTINAAGATAIASGAVDQDAIGAAAVGQSELKASNSAASVAISSPGTYSTGEIPGGYYTLGFKVYLSADYVVTFDGLKHGDLDTTPVGPRAYFTRTGGSPCTGYCMVYYVTASGEQHWIFILKDKATGKTLKQWESPDHPTFHNQGSVHPYRGYDPLKEEVIVVCPTMEQVERINAGRIPAMNGGFLTKATSIAGAVENPLKPRRSFLEAFDELYEIEESKQADWPDVPVTVALPRIHEGQIVDDWRFMPRQVYNPETKLMEPLKIQPVKRVIPRPDFVTPLKIKEKTK